MPSPLAGTPLDVALPKQLESKILTIQSVMKLKNFKSRLRLLQFIKEAGVLIYLENLALTYLLTCTPLPSFRLFNFNLHSSYGNQISND